MAVTDVIKEYLVSLGMQDNFTGKLKETLDKSDNEIGSFIKSFSKNFAVAGTFVASAISGITIGVAKFLDNIATADEEVEKYAKELGKTKEEAYKLKTALDSMGGISLEEVKGDKKLEAIFKQLQEDAEKIQIPDMTKGIEQVNSVKLEFTRLKQEGMLAINWLGHYILKYLYQPLKKVKSIFSNANDMIIKNIPVWAEKIGKFFASVTRLGITMIRAMNDIFNVIKRIFDMIPDEIKVVIASLAALALFIRAGPIGQLMLLITGLLFLLDDFYTYIDGGEALLGDFWQKLINIYNVFKESGAIENAKKLFSELSKIFMALLEPLTNVGLELLNILDFSSGNFLEWFVIVALPNAINLLLSFSEKLHNLITILNNLGILEGVIKGIGIAFAGWKINKAITKGIKKITSNVIKAAEKVTKFKDILIGVFTDTKTKILSVGTAIKSFFVANPFALWILGITALITALFLLYKYKDKIKEFIEIAETKVKEFINSIHKKLPDIINKIKDIFNTLASNLPEFAKMGIEIITSIVKGIIQAMPDILSALINILGTIITIIFDNLPALLRIGTEILKAFINGIIEMMTSIFKTKIVIAESIMEGILEIIPIIIDTIADVLDVIITTIIDGLPAILGMGFEILLTIIEGIIQALPFIFDTIVNILDKIVTIIVDNLPLLLEIGVKIILEIVKGIIKMIPIVWSANIKLLKEIITTIIKNLPKIKEAGIKILKALVEGIKKAVPQILQAIVEIVKLILEGLVQLVNRLLELGKEFVKNLWQQIKQTCIDMKDSVAEYFTEAYNKIPEIWDKIVKYFGELFDDAVRKIQKTFSPIIQWFSDRVDEIKGFFNSISEAISEAIGNAIGNITEFIGGLKTKVNEAKSWLGFGSDEGDNNATQNNDKNDDKKSHENGGLITRHTITEVAEGNKPELIVPLTRKHRAKELLLQGAKMIGMFEETFGTDRAYALSTSNSNINNNYNNYNFSMPSNYKIYDSSGRPESTAKAVDRTVQLRLRNMQGLL